MNLIGTFCALQGHIGVVLPRKALEASGMAKWRRELLRDATFIDVTAFTNTGGWVFDGMEPRYTVVLVSLRADGTHQQGRRLPLRGPFTSLQEYQVARSRPADSLVVDDLLDWSDTATFPLLPDADAQRTFLKIRNHPRLDRPEPGWDVRGLRELNATDDKDDFVFGAAPGLWPVYKGESFETWNPQIGIVYAWADPQHIVSVLQRRRANQVRNRRSAFYGMGAHWASDPATLPCQRPRIAWRDVARATDTRTVIAALVPPRRILVHQAYYLFWRDGGPVEEAYALGVLCSVPFNWYARRMVESHVTVEFMLAAPIPRPSQEDPLRQRVTEIAGRLTAVDDRYVDWADAVGVPVGSAIDSAARDDLIAELDAVVALAYGLDRDDVQRISPASRSRSCART
jgi:hypothetical protein